MRAKYESVCGVCEEYINVGDDIDYMDNECCHVGCGEYDNEYDPEDG
jgi:hypothetical protein